MAFLLRHGRTFNGHQHWSRSHFKWLADQKFEHPAHQIVFQDYINAVHDGEQRCQQLVAMIEKMIPEWSMKPLFDALCTMRGIDMIAAATILCATGDLRRFHTPGKLSAYFWAGAVGAFQRRKHPALRDYEDRATPKCGVSLTNVRGVIGSRHA